MSYDGQIPFTKDGNLLTYPGRYWVRGEFHEPEWRDNYVFDAILTLDRQERGRSAAHFILKDEKGHEYTMFLKELVDTLKREGMPFPGQFCWATDMTHGPLTWTFCKRGQNYGVCLAS